MGNLKKLLYLAVGLNALLLILYVYAIVTKSSGTSESILVHFGIIYALVSSLLVITGALKEKWDIKRRLRCISIYYASFGLLFFAAVFLMNWFTLYNVNLMGLDWMALLLWNIEIGLLRALQQNYIAKKREEYSWVIYSSIIILVCMWLLNNFSH